MWFVIITFGLLLIWFSYWIFWSPYEYWKNKGVPTPPVTVMVGNLGPNIRLKKNLGQLFKDIYDEFQDYLYVGYYKFRKPGIIIRDLDLIKDVLIKDFSSFHDNDLIIDEKTDPLFARNPFILRGHKWKVLRTQLSSSITNSKVKNMFNLIKEVTYNMIHYITKQRDASIIGIEVQELAAKFTTDAVALCAFGLEAKSFEEERSEFREIGKKFFSHTFWQAVQHVMIIFVPQLARIFQIKFVPAEVEDWFSRTILDTIKFREKNNVIRNDYLDLLRNLKLKPTQYGFDNQDVIAQCMTFYQDGFETSSIALAFTLYELAANPNIQNKLKKEIDLVLEKHSREFTYEAFQEMSYLDMVMTESLRKHTPLHFMIRLCTKPYELPPPKGVGTGPYVSIYPGTPVVISIDGIHHDPDIYPDPEVFDPERFSEENKKCRPKYSFLAFGEGPRICLGMKFALAQTKAAVVSIITNYEIRVNKKTKEPLQMDPQYLFKNAIGGIWLNFYPRDHTNGHVLKKDL